MLDNKPFTLPLAVAIARLITPVLGTVKVISVDANDIAPVSPSKLETPVPIAAAHSGTPLALTVNTCPDVPIGNLDNVFVALAYNVSPLV